MKSAEEITRESWDEERESRGRLAHGFERYLEA
jgi:hypothetical protein